MLNLKLYLLHFDFKQTWKWGRQWPQEPKSPTVYPGNCEWIVMICFVQNNKLFDWTNLTTANHFLYWFLHFSVQYSSTESVKAWSWTAAWSSQPYVVLCCYTCLCTTFSDSGLRANILISGTFARTDVLHIRSQATQVRERDETFAKVSFTECTTQSCDVLMMMRTPVR